MSFTARIESSSGALINKGFQSVGDTTVHVTPLDVLTGNISKVALSPVQPDSYLPRGDNRLKRKMTLFSSPAKKIRPPAFPPSLQTLEAYFKLSWEKGIPEPPLNDPLPKPWEAFTPSEKILCLARLLNGADPKNTSLVEVVNKAWDYIANLPTDKEILTASEAAEHFPLTVRTEERIAEIEILLQCFFFEEITPIKLKTYWKDLLVRDSEFFRAMFSGAFPVKKPIQAPVTIFEQLLKAQYLDEQIPPESTQEVYQLGIQLCLLPTQFLKDILDDHDKCFREPESQKNFIAALNGFSKRPNNLELRERLVETLVKTYVVVEETSSKRAYLRLISELPITRLHFENAPKKKEDIKELIAACPYLDHVSFGDLCVDFLFDLSKLRSVKFSYVSAQIIESLLTKCPRLEKLKVKNLRHLEKFSPMIKTSTSISLISVHSDHELTIASILEKLDQFNAFDVHVGNKSCDPRILEKAKSLSFECIQLNPQLSEDKILAQVAQVKRLEDLSIWRALTEQSILTLISQCKYLRKIKLREGCTDTALALIVENYPNLEELSLWECPITDHSVKALAAKCKSLKKLSLRHCPGVTDASILEIALNCKQLKAIELDEVSVTDKSLLALAASCKEIRSLRIGESNPLTKFSFNAMLNRLQKMYCLFLALTGPRVTTEELSLSLKKCSSLVEANIRYCEGKEIKGLWLLENNVFSQLM